MITRDVRMGSSVGARRVKSESDSEFPERIGESHLEYFGFILQRKLGQEDLVMTRRYSQLVESDVREARLRT